MPLRRRSLTRDASKAASDPSRMDRNRLLGQTGRARDIAAGAIWHLNRTPHLHGSSATCATQFMGSIGTCATSGNSYSASMR